MSIESGNPKDVPDLFITVGQPEKHGSGLDAYVSYNIVTKVDHFFHVVLLDYV